MPGEGNDREEGCVTLPWQCICFLYILPLHTECMLLNIGPKCMYGLHALWRSGVTFCISREHSDFHSILQGCLGYAVPVRYPMRLVARVRFVLWEAKEDLKIIGETPLFAWYLAMFGVSQIRLHCENSSLDTNVFHVLFHFLFFFPLSNGNKKS